MGNVKLWVQAGALILLGGLTACANRPPVVSCLPGDTTVVQGNTLTLKAEYSDRDRFAWGGDDDKLTLKWSADRGSISGEGGQQRTRGMKTTSADFEARNLAPGRYRITAEVSDRKLTTACTFDVTVAKNKLAPTVSCEPGTLTVTEGQSRTLSARASDPNGDALSFAWTVDGESVARTGDSFEFGSAGRTLGVHTVSVTVTDSDGLSAHCNFAVSIDRRPNRNPTVSLVLDADEVYAGERVGAEARASDPDGDPLSYSWTMDSQRHSERASRLSIDTSGMAGGRHGVSVTVEDDRGATATQAESFSVREKITLQVSGTRLDNIAKARLDEIALKMQQNPQLRAVITGHTDDRGSEGANQRLGMRRAEAARDYLVRDRSVDAARLETRSAGETQPMADNTTADGRRENRRLEIELFVP